MRVRKRVWEILDTPADSDRASRVFDVAILILIVLNVLAVVLESIEYLHDRYVQLFYLFELFSVAAFTLEYAARIWSCVEDGQYRDPILGRLRYAGRFMSIVDLVAFLPFYLPFVGVDLRFVRLLRTIRIVRLLKIGRYYASLKLIGSVCSAKKEELVMTSCVMVTLLVISACVMFHCEHAAQPDKFSSIPATMWWSVSTLTTVGYGDVYPITPLGKVFAAIISVLGIGMFALPTGILGSGFVEEIQKRRREHPKICPHCGKSLEG